MGDKFGEVMIDNLHNRGCSLDGVEHCRTLETQYARWLIKYFSYMSNKFLESLEHESASTWHGPPLSIICTSYVSDSFQHYTIIEVPVYYINCMFWVCVVFSSVGVLHNHSNLLYLCILLWCYHTIAFSLMLTYHCLGKLWIPLFYCLCNGIQSYIELHILCIYAIFFKWPWFLNWVLSSKQWNRSCW